MFDREKFIMDRNLGQPMTEEDIDNFDTYMAILTISMTPNLYREGVSLNTTDFTKLTKKVQAKVMQGFNGKHLNNGWLKAPAAAIADRDAYKQRVMKLYDTDGHTAEFMIQQNDLDRKVVDELYAYKFEGIAPKSKTSRGKNAGTRKK